jgi:hypothetical protein
MFLCYFILLYEANMVTSSCANTRSDESLTSINPSCTLLIQFLKKKGLHLSVSM